MTTTQYARPIADELVQTQAGGYQWWAGNGVSQTNLYQQIDEAVLDDSDFVRHRSVGSENARWYKTKLGTICKPSDMSTVKVSVTSKRTSSGYSITTYLTYGSTTIKFWSMPADSSATTNVTTLTESDANAIQSAAEAAGHSDWEDLQLWFLADDDNAYKLGFIYQAFLEAGASTTQYARPDSDVDNLNDAWTNSDGGAPDNTLYTYIDGASAGSDYVDATDDDCDGTGVYFTVGLDSLTDPESANCHAMKFYGKVDSVGSNSWFKIELLEGTTVRASKTIASPAGTAGVGTLYTHNLSVAEANSITDYDNLRLRIYAGDDDCEGILFSVYQAWFECPEAEAEDITITPPVAALVAAGVSPTITSGLELTPAAAQALAAAVSPSVSSGAEITPSAASAVAAAVSPTITSGTELTPAVAALVAAGSAPTITSGTEVTPAVAAAVAAGISPTVEVGGGDITITPPAAALVAAGISPTITSGTLLSSLVASAVATAVSPTVVTPGDEVTPAAAQAVVGASIAAIDPEGILYVTTPRLKPTSISSATIRRPYVSSPTAKTPSATCTIVSSQE